MPNVDPESNVSPWSPGAASSSQNPAIPLLSHLEDSVFGDQPNSLHTNLKLYWLQVLYFQGFENVFNLIPFCFILFVRFIFFPILGGGEKTVGSYSTCLGWRMHMFSYLSAISLKCSCSFYFLVVLGIKPMVLYMQGKYSTTELLAWPNLICFVLPFDELKFFLSIIYQL